MTHPWRTLGISLDGRCRPRTNVKEEPVPRIGGNSSLDEKPKMSQSCSSQCPVAVCALWAVCSNGDGGKCRVWSPTTRITGDGASSVLAPNQFRWLARWPDIRHFEWPAVANNLVCLGCHSVFCRTFFPHWKHLMRLFLCWKWSSYWNFKGALLRTGLTSTLCPVGWTT